MNVFKTQIIPAVSIGVLLALFCSGCSTPSFSTQATEFRQAFYTPQTPEYVYPLEFSENGLLMNISELLQAVRDINNSESAGNPKGPITNIVVVSYGWNHQLGNGEEDYFEFLTNYVGFLFDASTSNNALSLKPNTAIFCVAWPSGSSGLEGAVSELVPGKSSQYAGYPFELIFPLSVWSRASLANTIGYGDLPRALDYVCKNCYTNQYRPRIYLIGHSFGCRVLSGLVSGLPRPGDLFLHPVSHYIQRYHDVDIQQSDINDWSRFAHELQSFNAQKQPLLAYLNKHLSTQTQNELESHRNPEFNEKLHQSLVTDLNRWIRSTKKGTSIYDPQIFAGVRLSTNTAVLLGEQNRLHRLDGIILNRMLLQAAFTNEISSARFLSDSVTHDYNKYIRGGVFIEPALTEDDLPDPTLCANFPLLVTQSRHDYLNSFLFPIANILYNTGYSDDWDAFSARYLERDSSPDEPVNSYASRLRGTRGQIIGALVDLPRFPLAVVESILLWPSSWVAGQYMEITRGNTSWNTNYIFNTLAQLPIVDVPVRSLARDGSYYKGLFNFGLWNESASRVSWERPVPIDSIVTTNGELNVRNGITFITAEDIISRSIFWQRIDYSKRWQDYSIWIDPVGSHDDYGPHADQAGAHSKVNVEYHPTANANGIPQIDYLIYLLVHDRVHSDPRIAVNF